MKYAFHDFYILLTVVLKGDCFDATLDVVFLEINSLALSDRFVTHNFTS